MLGINESQHAEFKEKLNINNSYQNSQKDWLTIIKAIIAMANSGGGKIYIGVKDDGSFSGADVSSITNTDPVDFTKKIKKYTGVDFSDFNISSQNENNNKIVIVEVNASEYPIVFEKQGAYRETTNGQNKDKTMFQAGTIYFRNGAQSTVAASNNIKNFIDKKVREKTEKVFDQTSGQLEALSNYFGDEQVHFNPYLIYINIQEHKLEITGTLINRKSPPPNKIWITTYIFEEDNPEGGSYSIEPIEIKNPFRDGDKVEISESADLVCMRNLIEPKPRFRSRSHVSSKSKDLSYVEPPGRLKTFEGSLLVLYRD